ncbi:MAG: isopeptide-forming domain-containing fimbrial protein [Acutalibacter sp.]|jgi:fimbrial isopeptide formation D2 family protein/LPXTG-motif cell wall-anchored protein|uniref:SpaA isopeptide-forming pilin-related protein n=1 Tax=Acutalibacter sp. TaxID=1918636 RepID=UPI00216BDF0F|nr:SpaA isopeptide-forming pilin-related protein [Acutalibacter sp.]MCI9225730.1 isopeptide-forming domain-containing fimbrial protein [Acutalibacter sp.]
MRSLSRLLAVLLALGSIMGLCVPAFAGEDIAQTGTVTIENAKNGDIYKLYLLASKDGDQYVPVEGWGLRFNGEKVLYNGTEITEANVVNTASKLLEVSKEKAVSYTASGSDGKAGFTGVQYGYYLVDYGNGMSGLFELNAETMVLEMKRDNAPKLEKKIVLADGSKVDYTTVKMGDNVQFEVTAVLPGEDEIEKYGGSGYQCYLVDEIFPGLEINEDVSVQIDGKEFVKSGQYEGKGDNEQGGDTNTVRVNYQNDHRQFSVKFGAADNWGSSLEFLKAHPGAIVTIKYSAKVMNYSSETDIAWNRAKLIYRDKVIEDEVYLYNFTIVLNKFDSTDKAPLSGAQFALMNSEGKYYWTDGKKDMSYHAGDYVEWIEADYNSDTGIFTNYGEKPPSVWTTDMNNWKGHLTFGGIASGTYQLIEVKAPENYNKLVNPINIEIKVKDDTDPSKVEFIAIVDGKETVIQEGGIPWASNWKPLQFTVDVANSKGTLLPSTGGMGTTLFYIGGGALVIGAASFILFRKRGG